MRILVNFLLMLTLIFVHGFVAAELWNMFVAPTFQLPVLNWVIASMLSLTFSAFKGVPLSREEYREINRKKNDLEKRELLLENISIKSSKIIAYLLLWGIGYCFYCFM